MTWWRRLISRDRLEDQLDSELRDHFERLVAEYRQQGHADPESRRLARLDFGGLDQVKEACRDVRGTRWIDDTVQDIRHGVRGFVKTPGFTAVAVLTLALGIGANLAIFNVLDALLLRPLPVPNAPRLVTLTRWIENSSSESFSYPQIRALADRPDLFASLCGIGGATLFTGPPDGLFQARLMRSLTAIFGALALLLAAVGLYGLMSYMVTTRTREIGVRLALGARPARVLGMVLGNALRMVVIGIIIGLPLALLSSRLIAGMVFGLTPTDAATIAAAIAVLACVGAVSAALPARRAATMNPVTAIHVE